MPGTLDLRRFCYAPGGTFGGMMVEGVQLFTVERPWLCNRPYVSCIPEGKYQCWPRRFYRGGYPAVEVGGVPGRTHILFHRANVPEDVAGCIGVGSRLGVLGDKWAVLESLAAFEFFMERWGQRELFDLRITGPQPAVLED